LKKGGEGGAKLKEKGFQATGKRILSHALINDIIFQ
jgi:hypothetical protein